ncbi:MAG: hypothetical protein DWH73_04200 [Planctomycetota bacterium]|jgi:hypothetical protein|nr:MAG: hypothetical protein DWH73_04200 [Planctomycetota bacterium]
MKTSRIIAAITLGLSLAVASPKQGQAAQIGGSKSTGTLIQNLATPEMSSSRFNELFTPLDAAPSLNSAYQYLGEPVSGSVKSQVFQGQGAASGLFAYAYQVSVNPGNNSIIHTDSISFQFNATPEGTDLTNLGTPTFAYVVKDGAIGGLSTPAASVGQSIADPSSLSWQSGATTGVLRAQYVDPATQTQPLLSGATSSTFVVLSKFPFTTQFVNLQSGSPTTGPYTQVYSATGGSIDPVPVPEPATILSWAGVIGGLLAARRYRRS